MYIYPKFFIAAPALYQNRLSRGFIFNIVKTFSSVIYLFIFFVLLFTIRGVKFLFYPSFVKVYE